MVGRGRSHLDRSRVLTGAAAVIGINIYFGLFLAELCCDTELHDHLDRRSILLPVLSSALIVGGGFIISFPEDKPEWATWSTAMVNAGHHFFPANSEYGRFYPGIGAQMLCLGILFNPTAKRVLSNPLLCWLGKVSFAIYLTHAPLLRTILAWMVFGLSTPPSSPGLNAEGQALPPGWRAPVGPVAMALLVPLWYVLIYRMASWWVAYVDPWCGRATNRIEELCFGDETKLEKSLLLA
jgi:peptidoglycan/LPS O-acetylase OafA/YrhL